MHKTILYGHILIGIFLIPSLNSWGSETLPQLSTSSHSRMGHAAILDTIPAKATTIQEQQPTQAIPETVVQPIKKVPKSRKKLKPATVTPKVNVPPAKIIKPKIVIKKINVNVP